MTQYACPCCKSTKYVEINLHFEGFAENLFGCTECNAEWICKHNGVEIIKDSNVNSLYEQDEQCTDGTIPNLV